MAKKQKLNKAERRDQRLRKARQWALTYTGAHVVKAYKTRFRLDDGCALQDLRDIGVLDPERYAAMKNAEEQRLSALQKKRAEESALPMQERFLDSDDRFFFIAGYTSGGAPYGVTWEEMGLSPYEMPEDVADFCDDEP